MRPTLNADLQKSGRRLSRVGIFFSALYLLPAIAAFINLLRGNVYASIPLTIISMPWSFLTGLLRYMLGMSSNRHGWIWISTWIVGIPLNAILIYLIVGGLESLVRSVKWSKRSRHQ